MRVVLLVLGLLLITAPVYGFQGISPQQNLDIIWQQVDAQPQDFAVACMPLNNRQGTVLYQPSEPFPLASVSKLLLLIEYANRVDSGAISIGEMVNVATLNRYNLPRTDRGAHDRFMAQYSASIQTLSLWDVVTEGMIQYSSNAASDYLLDRLDPVDWDRLYQSLNVTQTGRPHALTMIPLMMNNHVNGQPALDTVGELSIDEGRRLFNLYMTNEAWREQEIAYRSERRRSFPAWEVQSTILQQHTVNGTVYDFLRVMTAVYDTGGALNDNVKQIVRAALRWDGYENINTTYFEYGSKLGLYSGGTLTLVAYGNPRESGPVISVAFFRNIPRDTYREMLNIDSIGDFAHWMNLNGCRGLSSAILDVT